MLSATPGNMKFISDASRRSTFPIHRLASPVDPGGPAGATLAAFKTFHITFELGQPVSRHGTGQSLPDDKPDNLAR